MDKGSADSEALLSLHLRKRKIWTSRILKSLPFPKLFENQQKKFVFLKDRLTSNQMGR